MAREWSLIGTQLYRKIIKTFFKPEDYEFLLFKLLQGTSDGPILAFDAGRMDPFQLC